MKKWIPIGLLFLIFNIAADFFLLNQIDWRNSDRITQDHDNGSSQSVNNTPPEVSIVMPVEGQSFQWGGQFRYVIGVSDHEDGESRFGEINPNEVILEIEFIPHSRKSVDRDLSDLDPSSGLSLMRKSTCFSCHADKTTLIGPSFGSIAEQYNRNTDSSVLLGNRIREGTSGVWGGPVMPPHPHFTPEEAQKMAEYILSQGSSEFKWIYLGLEGVFRFMDKPDGEVDGTFILTASYLDNGIEGKAETALSGYHSIVITAE